MEPCSVLCGSLDGGVGIQGRMESLHFSPDTIVALLIGYAPVWNEKFKRKKAKV